MTVKNLVRLVAISTIASLLLVSVASAHVQTSNTRLRLQVSDTKIHKGQRVTFRGTLSSDWGKCYKFRQVKLQKNGNTILSKRTDANGKVAFTRKVYQDSDWNLKYKGRRWGKHPHRHVCRGSTSRTIFINVKGN
jgi:hypothetical protein